MIPTEGRVMLGLDEFMLRLGHLKLLCQLAAEFGGPLQRLMRKMMLAMTTKTPISKDSHADIAAYLSAKHLCALELATAKPATSRRSKFRYPSLRIAGNPDSLTVSNATLPTNDAEPDIWWQDACLADSRVISKVGAITFSAKSGSKTGVSHVLDWALALGLISRSGRPTPLGHALIGQDSRHISGDTMHNPYVMKSERLFFAYAVAKADMDILSQFAPLLQSSSAPIRKRDGAQLFATAVKQAAEIGKQKGGSTYFPIKKQLRDLEKATSKKTPNLGSSSTSWHRASSRLETYCDLGWLSKGAGGPQESYEYIYYPTPLLSALVTTLARATSFNDWAASGLTDAVFPGKGHSDELSLDDLIRALPQALKSISSLLDKTPIEELTLGVVRILFDEGHTVTFGAVRDCVEKLARERPEIARLARGTSGQRAEFVSINIRGIRP